MNPIIEELLLVRKCPQRLAQFRALTPFGRCASISAKCVITRRKFFSHAAREVVTGIEEARGRRHFTLADLRAFPDERLQNVVPKLVDGATSGREFSGVQQLVFNYFDGRKSLEEIAAAVAEKTGLTAAEAFSETKRLFLQLANRCECFPANVV